MIIRNYLECLIRNVHDNEHNLHLRGICFSLHYYYYIYFFFAVPFASLHCMYFATSVVSIFINRNGHLFLAAAKLHGNALQIWIWIAPSYRFDFDECIFIISTNDAVWKRNKNRRMPSMRFNYGINERNIDRLLLLRSLSSVIDDIFVPTWIQFPENNDDSFHIIIFFAEQQMKCGSANFFSRLFI